MSDVGRRRFLTHFLTELNKEVTMSTFETLMVVLTILDILVNALKEINRPKNSSLGRFILINLTRPTAYGDVHL